MTAQEIQNFKTLLGEYDSNFQKLVDERFSANETEAFKKYYSNLYKILIQYVQHMKDKEISKKAKKIKLPDDLFKKTYLWMGMTGIIIVFPSIILLNMNFLNYSDDLLLPLALICGVLIFWVIRKTQQQLGQQVDLLKNNGAQCANLLDHIKEKD